MARRGVPTVSKVPVFKGTPAEPLWIDNGSGVMVPAWAADPCDCCGGGGIEIGNCVYCVDGKAPKCVSAAVSGFGTVAGSDFSVLNGTYMLHSIGCVPGVNNCCCWFLSLDRYIFIPPGTNTRFGQLAFQVCQDNWSFCFEGTSGNADVSACTFSPAGAHPAPHNCLGQFSAPIKSFFATGISGNVIISPASC